MYTIGWNGLIVDVMGLSSVNAGLSIALFSSSATPAKSKNWLRRTVVIICGPSTSKSFFKIKTQWHFIYWTKERKVLNVYSTNETARCTAPWCASVHILQITRDIVVEGNYWIPFHVFNTYNQINLASICSRLFTQNFDVVTAIRWLPPNFPDAVDLQRLWNFSP